MRTLYALLACALLGCSASNPTAPQRTAPQTAHISLALNGHTVMCDSSYIVRITAPRAYLQCYAYGSGYVVCITAPDSVCTIDAALNAVPWPSYISGGGKSYFAAPGGSITVAATAPPWVTYSIVATSGADTVRASGGF